MSMRRAMDGYEKMRSNKFVTRAAARLAAAVTFMCADTAIGAARNQPLLNFRDDITMFSTAAERISSIFPEVMKTNKANEAITVKPSFAEFASNETPRDRRQRIDQQKRSLHGLSLGGRREWAPNRQGYPNTHIRKASHLGN
jgi:hypothetical protein